MSVEKKRTVEREALGEKVKTLPSVDKDFSGEKVLCELS